MRPPLKARAGRRSATRFLIVLSAGVLLAGLPGAAAAISHAGGTATGLIAFTSDRTGTSQLYVMRGDGSNQKRLTKGKWANVLPVWSPDGKRIAFTRLQGKGLNAFGVYTMNVDGSRQHKLATGIGGAWSPDGKRIAYLRLLTQTNSEIYVIDSDGSGQRRLTTTKASEAVPSWSPNGTQLAFDSSLPDSGGSPEDHLYVMNADGSGPRRLTFIETELFSTSPDWSPDGKKIAFVSWKGTISTINPDGTDEKALRTQKESASSINDANLVWSPDGKKIAFIHHNSDEGKNYLYLVNADGSGLRKLDSNLWLDGPTWSSDSKQIAYTKPADKNINVYTINANGTRQRLLATRGQNQQPDWQPTPPH